MERGREGEEGRKGREREREEAEQEEGRRTNKEEVREKRRVRTSHYYETCTMGLRNVPLPSSLPHPLSLLPYQVAVLLFG